MATERRFAVQGAVDLATAHELQTKLLVLLDATDDDLLLDCSGLTFIDSSGIAVFVHVQKALEVQGRGFRVANMSERVRRPFDMLGLTEVLGIGELETT